MNLSSVDTSGCNGRPISQSRVWTYRLLSIFLGLSVFAVLELICVAAGWGESQAGDDPLVGFASVRPLFEPTDDGVTLHTSPARRGYFKEVSFAARKPLNEFRIFVFGGSTVQGNPFSIETSFPTYLQIALQHADPSKQWKVVNCGGVSYASYRLLPVMQECLGWEPDLYIYCGGHNQFLEYISFEDVRQSATVTGPVLAKLSRLRSYRILQRAIKGKGDAMVESGDSAQTTLPVEVDTMLDHKGGLARYHRDDSQATMITQLFAENLRAMATMADRHNVPLLFVLPPSNLSDCPPFKSEFSRLTSSSDRDTVTLYLHQARRLATSDLPQAISLLRLASKIDPRYALTWYELGQLQLTAHEFSNAASSFTRARDEDVCPLRMTSSLESAMRDAARVNSIPMIDAHALMAKRCPQSIVGAAALVDHVHPSFRGHEDIAMAITDWMLKSGYALESTPSWKADAVLECRSRLQALDDLYFLKGQRALRSLKLWAAGRASETPIVPSTTTGGDSSASQDEEPLSQSSKDDSEK